MSNPLLIKRRKNKILKPSMKNRRLYFLLKFSYNKNLFTSSRLAELHSLNNIYTSYKNINQFMPKVSFNYNFKKDAWSWVLIAKDQKCWGIRWKDQVDFIPDNLLEKILKKNRKNAEFLVYKYLISRPKREMYKTTIREEILTLEKIWRKIENKFFEKLKKVIQKPIFTDSFKCYFTSGFMCPYNEKENWFMVSVWHSVPKSITTICHEILHLQFLHYYKDYCMKFLSKKQTEDLKESLTFLLNTNFNDLLLCEDFGYPAHRKLRKKLEKIWQREKNFKQFLDKAIKTIKRNF